MILIRIEEGGTVREVEVAGETVIGRGETAGIRTDEPRASREHASVAPVPGGVVVADLGSTNGTFREETRILRERVRAGESFRIGGTAFTVVERADEAPRRSGGGVRPLLSALAPAAVLFGLCFAGLQLLESGRADDVANARQRLALARYRIAAHPADPGERAAALAAYAGRWPDSPWAKAAAEEAAALQPKLDAQAEAAAALAELEARAGDLPAGELEYRCERLFERFAGVPEALAVVRAALERRDAERAAAADRELAATVEQARRLAARGDVGAATALLDEYAARRPADVADSEIRTLQTEIGLKAAAACRDAISYAGQLVAEGRREEGLASLASAAESLAGSGLAGILDLRARALAKAVHRPTPTGPTPGATADDFGALRREYQTAAARAEELAGAGEFGPAADAYAGVLGSVRIAAVREEFGRREAELRGIAALFSGLREKLATAPKSFNTVRIGEARFRVEAFERNVLTLAAGSSRTIRSFSELTPEELVGLVRASKPSPAERLSLAAYCFDLNLQEAWLEEILAALEDERTLEPAGRLYARKEGRAWPDGGFVAYRGRVLTRAEHAEEVHREKVAELRKRQTELFGRLKRDPMFEKRLAKLVERRADLDAAREHALELIFDEVKYFYPYHQRMAEYTLVQKEVDLRVAAVRKIWDEPTTYSMKSEGSLKSTMKAIDEVVRELDALGIDTAEYRAAVKRYTRHVDCNYTIRNFPVDAAEAELLDYDRRVMEWNEALESSASEMERAQVRITNEYRLMMGRRAVVLDERLLKAARGHSDEMSRLGYFSHTSPTEGRQTPMHRVALEGYKGMPVSENIHMGTGTPEGAHHGWTHSSGHHRNILQPFWTEMGTGNSGRYWTQNFGRTELHKFPNE